MGKSIMAKPQSKLKHSTMCCMLDSDQKQFSNANDLICATNMVRDMGNHLRSWHKNIVSPKNHNHFTWSRENNLGPWHNIAVSQKITIKSSGDIDDLNLLLTHMSLTLQFGVVIGCH